MFTTPDGSEDVVMVSCPTIVSEKLLLAVRWFGLVESVTVIFTVLVAAEFVVPLMAPLDGSILRPAGNPVADHVYGVVPPVAATVALYAVPATPPGSGEVVVIDTVPAARMDSEKDAVAV